MSNEISTAIGSVTTAMTEQINVATIGGIVAGVLAAGVGLYVAWFAMRKTGSGLKGALRGKLKF